jgi:hypothetical protein
MNIKVNRYKNPAITARTGFEGSIEPEGNTSDQAPDKALSWILYWRPDGSAQLWTERAPTGHVIGAPIELKAGALATLNAHGLMHESEPEHVAVCAYHSVANGEGCGTCLRCNRLTPVAPILGTDTQGFSADARTPRTPLDTLSICTPSAPVSDDALWVPAAPAEVTS